MASFYRSTVQEFLGQDEEQILARLGIAYANRGYTSQYTDQTLTWQRDRDYRWALIGEPRRKYLWILSREPRMEEKQVQDILARARQQGYDTARVIRTTQSATGQPPPVRPR
jgi:lipocalin